MKTGEILSGILTIALILFLIRWIINWILLNRKNGTSYSIFRANYAFKEILGIFIHIAVSEWKIWWFDTSDNKDLKIISNTLSAVIYTSILLLFIMFIYNYKIN